MKTGRGREKEFDKIKKKKEEIIFNLEEKNFKKKIKSNQIIQWKKESE